jgi:hypothetical protein
MIKGRTDQALLAHFKSTILPDIENGTGKYRISEDETWFISRWTFLQEKIKSQNAYKFSPLSTLSWRK